MAAWKEAGVGMVATYRTPLDPETEDPQRVVCLCAGAR